MLKTYEQIKKIENTQLEAVNFAEPSTQLVLDKPTTSAYAKLMQRATNSANVGMTGGMQNMKQKLLLLAECNIVPFETDVLQYWHKKTSDAELKKIIDVVLAVPATQVSVERAFSALGIILTKLRTKLSKNTLNMLLTTKLNFKELDNKEVEFHLTEE